MWGGGAIRFRSDTKSGGGGGGGGQSAYDGRGGGGAVHFWHTENTLSLIIHCFANNTRGFANRYSITKRA